jgi:hypothetical protein
MRVRGFEPPLFNNNQILNLTRLPIPPHPPNLSQLEPITKKHKNYYLIIVYHWLKLH